MKVKLGGKEYDVSDEIGKAIQDMGAMHKKSMKDADDQLDAALDMIEQLKGGKKDSDDALLAKIDELEKQLKEFKEISEKIDSDEEFRKRLKEHNKVAAVAGRVLKDVKLDEMDVSEIKVAVIKADSPDLEKEKLDSDAYVDARFDLIAEKYAKSDSSKEEAGKDIIDSKKDRKDENDKKLDVAEQARADSIKELIEAQEKRMEKLNAD